MDFSEYQKLAKKTAIYPKRENPLWYPALGLAGEAGEVANKIKKIMRDHRGKVSDEDRKGIVKEMGDVLWYMAMLAVELKVDFSLVAEENITKIMSRKKRGKIHGSGDER